MALSETTVGVLIGAGATVGGSLVVGLFGFLVDSRRRRWEDRRRWHEVRRETYADYLSGKEAFEDRAHALAELALRKLRWDAMKDAGEEPFDLQEKEYVARFRSSEERLDDRRERLKNALSMINLIGSSAVRAAVEKYEDATTDLWIMATVLDGEPEELNDTLDEMSDEVDEMSSRCRQAREAFRHKVMEELGVERPRRWRVWKR